jgi:Fur family ferric uptake transcriptional regulator
MVREGSRRAAVTGLSGRDEDPVQLEGPPGTPREPAEHGAARGWDEQLRARGYRVTPQRQLVLEAIGQLDHATPEEIAATVQKTAKGVNMSTIYRTLELLDNLGLVTHHHLNDGAPTYHLASEGDHVHLVCQECGKLSEVRPEAIKPLITALDREQGFETDVAHLTVFGRCADCRRKQAAP